MDPPFNSKADYNILFKTPENISSPAQVTAFEDTWYWTSESELAFNQLLSSDSKIASVIKGIRDAIGTNDMMAYLVMMAIRLVELHRVLKDTGSLYLHCDPTASHYLKIILDAVFGVHNFRNEIIWDRVRGLSSISKNFRKAHDVILRYAKSDNYVFFNQYKEKTEEYAKQFNKKDQIGYYTSAKLLGPGKTQKGDTGKVWRGVDPNKQGKNGSHWIYKIEKLEELDRQEKILYPKKKGGTPRIKFYLHESKGIKVSDAWTDIPAIESQSKESMGYPTQKPLVLLERIIKSSSNENNVVLDPFCGCGTAVHASQQLNRNWIGIDVTHLAIGLIEKRMKDAFGIKINVEGIPNSFESAEDLAKRSKSQFETWAISLIPNILPNEKQVGDKGVDGVGYIQLGKDKDGKRIDAKIIASVKGGDNLNPGMIRDLVGTMNNQKAELGVFISLREPTSNMITESTKAGIFETPLGGKYPKLQIYSISDHFNGKQPKLPSLIDFVKAPKSKKDFGIQMTFRDIESE